jgi:hypothetical protein
MSNNKQSYKITDEQFTETFMENSGSYTETAKAIEKKYGIPYTRQAVFARAKNLPETVKEAIELSEELSDSALLKFAADENNDIRLRIRIHMHRQTLLSRYRLQNMKIEAVKSLQPQEEPEVIVDLGDKNVLF